MHLFLNIFNKVWALGLLLQEVGKSFNISDLINLSLDCRRIDPVQRPSMKCVLERVKDIAMKTVSYRVNMDAQTPRGRATQIYLVNT